MVRDVSLIILSDTSVRVSWTRVRPSRSTDYTLDSYIIYYTQKGTRKQESVTVSSGNDNLVIQDLTSMAEYNFQVATIINVDGELIQGLRSSAVEAELSFCKLVHGNELLDTVNPR